MASAIIQAGEILRRSAHTVALTGAGISTSSGIPDFRSPQSGLWAHYDPMQVASLWAFHQHPESFYDWLRPMLAMIMMAQPNAAHRVLADMEAQQRLAAVLTQNIDSLHQKAGSRRVLELHGHTRTASCLQCHYTTPAGTLLSEVLAGRLPPPCPECGGPLKPDVILFGEPLPYEIISAAQQEALGCDVMLVIGTSLEVMPAADLPLLARRRGARIVLINHMPTPIDDQMDIIIRADVASTLQSLWRFLCG